MNYDIISNALNVIATAHNFSKVTESLRRYVNDPTLEVPDYINEYSKVLIQVGRERPLYFAKLMDMVDQIRMGTGDPDLYTEEQKADVERAFEELYQRARPTKLIDAIRLAAASDAPWSSALGKTELKPFAPLVKLYRGKPEKFEEMIKLREYMRRDDLRKNLNERRKALRIRRAKLAELVQFKSKWLTPALVEREADERMAQAMKARHQWVKGRPAGMTSVDASYEYWELYDKQLDDALAMVERAKKGASVIAKEVKYPQIQR